MITSYNPSITQATIGQYATVKTSYVSTKDLSGLLLKFSPATYDNGQNIPPSSPAFNILYPAPGIYPLTNLSSNNYEATLIVTDAFNFQICFSFFVTKDFSGWHPDSNIINADAFDYFGNSFNADVGFWVNICNEDIFSQSPISVNGFCIDEVDFGANGFTLGQDLEIPISIEGTLNNNFYVGLIRKDAINNSGPIFPGLVSNYALVNNGIQDVNGFDKDCFKDGTGFITSGTTSTASLTIDRSCLTKFACFCIYVVYFKDGEWQSCLSDPIKVNATNANISLDGTYTAIDDLGNTTESNCISGLSDCIGLDLCHMIDMAAFQDALNDAGLTGSFSDYYESISVFEASSPSATGGTAISFDEISEGNVCINDFKPLNTGTTYAIIQYTFNYGTHRDIVNVPFQLIYDAVTTQIDISIGSLCVGETYQLDLPDCDIYTSINGSDYELGIISSSIDTSGLSVGDIICGKAVCSDPIDDPCVCPDCENITVNIDISSENCVGFPTPNCDGNFTANVVSTNSPVANFNINTIASGQTVASAGNAITVNFNFGNESFQVIWTLNIELENGCTYTVSGSDTIYNDVLEPGETTRIQKQVTGFGNGQEDCDLSGCDGNPTDPIECGNNIASLVYECDPETGDITGISVIENFEDTPSNTPQLLCSFDQGLTFGACPSSISGEPNVLLSYDAEFDGCPDIHLQETILCEPSIDCGNSRSLSCEVVNDQLIITITDSFTSTPISDIMQVSTDNGANYTTYNPSSSYNPITVANGDQIIIKTDTDFADGCPTVSRIATKELIEEPNNPNCDYSGFSLDCKTDEQTCEVKAAVSGNTSSLIKNDIYYTLDGSNPLLADGTILGMLYSGVIKGQGAFIFGACIQMEGCEPHYMWESCFIKPVELEFPEVLDVEIKGKTGVYICDNPNAGGDTKNPIPGQ